MKDIRLAFYSFPFFQVQKIKGWYSIASTVTLDKTALCIDITSYIKGTSQFILFRGKLMY